MFQIVPFKAAHIGAIKLQTAQMYLSEWVTQEQAEALEQSLSYTAMLDDVPLGSAGVIEMWKGRGLAWALISQTGPKHFVKCHRAVVRFLEACMLPRVEMTVDCDHKEAHRWAKLLGFEMEAERMRAYAPDGHDCALYSRIL
tara:strand:- start:2123 stop:2548 length:426 start_codon:yes stop_codon:yes gene_type:complete